MPLRPVLLAAAGIGAMALAVLLALTQGESPAVPPAGEQMLPPAAGPPPGPVPRPAQPSFDIVRISPEGNAVMAGRAAPGAEVVVRDGDRMLGRVQADEHGEWVFVPDHPLPPGSRQLRLTARGPGGQTAESDGSVLLVVPERGGNAEQGPPLAVLAPRHGGVRILQAPGNAARRGQLGLDTVDYGDAGDTRLTGTAPPGSPVRVYIGGEAIGDAVAGPDGRWTLSTGRSLPASATLRLDQLAPDGEVLARVELPFSRMTVTATEVSGGRVLVRAGQTLWSLARAAYGSGVQYTAIYQANRDRIRDPHLIYPGQALSVPRVAPPASGAPTPASASRSR